MKKLTHILVILSSFVLALSACSKKESDKGPRLRDRVRGQSGKTTGAEPFRRASDRSSDDDRLGDSSSRKTGSRSGTSSSDEYRHFDRHGKGQACHLNKDEVSDGLYCHGVILALGSTNVAVEWDEKIYTQSTGPYPFESREIKKNGDRLVAETILDLQGDVLRPELKVLQIMEGDFKVGNHTRIETNDDLGNLERELNDLNLKNSDHVLILTNVEDLYKDVDTQKLVGKIISEKTTQKELVISKVTNNAEYTAAKERIVREKDFLNAVLVPLTFTLQIPAEFEDSDVKLSVNDNELNEDQYYSEYVESPRRLLFTLTDLDVIDSDSKFKVQVELEEQ